MKFVMLQRSVPLIFCQLSDSTSEKNMSYQYLNKALISSRCDSTNSRKRANEEEVPIK